MFKAKVKRKKLEWEIDQSAQTLVEYFAGTEHFSHIRPERIFCYKTTGSKARAYARTWMMPKIFQQALGIEPAYVIECLTEHFDKLSDDQKKKVIIHELLHIPKNFSGSLVPHKRGVKSINSEVKRISKLLKI